MDSQILDLRELIEEARAELIQLGMRRSFTDPEVVKVSQSLDQLLNKYEYLRYDYRYALEYKEA